MILTAAECAVVAIVVFIIGFMLGPWISYLLIDKYFGWCRRIQTRWEERGKSEKALRSMTDNIPSRLS